MQKSDSTTPQHGLPLKGEKHDEKRAKELLDREIDEDELESPSAGQPGTGEPVSRHDPRANQRPADQKEPPRPSGP